MTFGRLNPRSIDEKTCTKLAVQLLRQSSYRSGSMMCMMSFDKIPKVLSSVIRQTLSFTIPGLCALIGDVLKRTNLLLPEIDLLRPQLALASVPSCGCARARDAGGHWHIWGVGLPNWRLQGALCQAVTVPAPGSGRALAHLASDVLELQQGSVVTTYTESTSLAPAHLLGSHADLPTCRELSAHSDRMTLRTRFRLPRDGEVFR